MIEGQQVVQPDTARTIRLAERLIAAGYSPGADRREETYLTGHFHSKGEYTVHAGVHFQPTWNERYHLWQAGIPARASMLSYIATPNPDTNEVDGSIYFFPKGANKGEQIPLSEVQDADTLVERLNGELAKLVNKWTQ